MGEVWLSGEVATAASIYLVANLRVQGMKRGNLRITSVPIDDHMNDPEHLPTSDITPPCPRSEKELTKETVTVTHTIGMF